MYTKIIAVAFGHPFDPKTFSGYSTHLFGAIEKMGCQVTAVSSKQLRLWDMFYGCVNYDKLKTFNRPELSIRWLWREKTAKTLSRRVLKAIEHITENVPILQVGTHILPVDGQRRSIYCVTDMTVIQAVRAGFFRVQNLNKLEVETAVALQKKMFDSYRKIFVLCAWTKESIIRDYYQPDKKIIIVGAGANIPPLEPTKDKYTSKEILFVGVDWLRKGGPLLLDAFRIVRQYIPSAKLNIVGCSPKICESGVQVYGILSRKDLQQLKDLYDLYRRANCFAILPEFDPFPNVLLEAQMARTPVVSLRTGSREDAVQDGITGLLVRKAKPKHVANALLRILMTPDYAQKMGQSGHDFVSQNYTWDIIAEKILHHMTNDTLNYYYR